MDSDYIQHVRYKLQKRLKRLNAADFRGFHFVLIQAWGFLQESEITKGLLDDLERRSPQCEQDADKTIAGVPQVGLTSDASLTTRSLPTRPTTLVSLSCHSRKLSVISVGDAGKLNRPTARSDEVSATVPMPDGFLPRRMCAHRRNREIHFNQAFAGSGDH
jgi:hypothetical protein